MGNAWSFMDYASKDHLLDGVRRESAGMFELLEDPAAWTAPTGAGDWQARDVVGHIVDTTETYFVGFDAAAGQGEPPPGVPLRDMAPAVDAGARQFRDLDRDAMLDRLHSALDRMLAIEDALTEQEWGGLQVPHKYMGPLPAFFYPAFQLVDYTVHSWDIREGSGRPHALDSRSADLLVPLCFVLWQATHVPTPEAEAMELGLRITSGENAGTSRLVSGPDGLTLSPGPVEDLATVIDIDPGSFVLTAYGRMNAGTIHGDREPAHRLLASFFRI